MTRSTQPRVVRARRMVALGTAAATAFAASAFADEVSPQSAEGGSYRVAQSESQGDHTAGSAEGHGAKMNSDAAAGGGEGEGGGADAAPEIALMGDLGFMTGHLRAGMHLYETGDVQAAKTHMGHPIAEKYDAVADMLEKIGHGGMRTDLTALVEAAEGDASVTEVRTLFDAVIARVAEARTATDTSTREQILGLAELMRIAGAEYALAVEGGTVSNLHEYQDSWGFIQTIRSEGERFARMTDPEIAETGAEIVRIADQVLAAAFGDIQGGGIPAMDPSALYGGAARIELAGLGLG